ncbi:hypothetical protein Tco_0946498 [Tanacetum coccineum]
MITLQFADTHNLVVFLAKPAESKGFEQIVDFLNAHTIKYALTVNPTIYTSIIEQFWATVKVKPVNGEVQLQALVDGKKIIITEASVRRDLQLNDEEAINQKFNFSKYIFESMVKNLDNAGKFLMYPRRETPLFPTMVVQNQADMGEGSAIPTDPHHTPTIIQPSTSQPQRKQRPRKPKRKDIEIPQSSGPTDNVADEAVNKEMDGSLERAATTATSLDAEQDIGNTLQSGEDRLKLQKLMELCTNLQNRVIDLENTKTAQAQDITSLKLRVKKLEKKGGSRTHKLKRLYKEDASKQGRKIDDIDKDAKITLVDETQGRYGVDIMFDVSDLAGEEVFVAEQGVPDSKKDDAAQVNTAATIVSTASTILVSAASITYVEITLAQALSEFKSAKPTTASSTRSKAKGLVIHEKEQAPTLIVSSQQPSQAKIQDKAEFDEQERIEREEAEANIALKETWDDIQEKIEADQLLAERLQAREQEELTIEERAILFQQLLEKRRKHFAAKRE